MVLHEYERAPVAQEERERCEGLSTGHLVESAAGVRDVEVFTERHIVLQHQADTVGVHPFLPENNNTHDRMECKP